LEELKIPAGNMPSEPIIRVSPLVAVRNLRSEELNIVNRTHDAFNFVTKRRILFNDLLVTCGIVSDASCFHFLINITAERAEPKP
jgi:hypothetical protein